MSPALGMKSKTTKLKLRRKLTVLLVNYSTAETLVPGRWVFNAFYSYCEIWNIGLYTKEDIPAKGRGQDKGCSRPGKNNPNRDGIFKLLRSPGIDSAVARARISNAFKSPGIDSQSWRAGTTTLWRNCLPSYIGWRNRFHLQIRALAGGNDNPIPTRFLALADCYTAQFSFIA